MVALDHALRRIRQDGGSDLLRSDPINQLARQQGHVFRDTALTPGRISPLSRCACIGGVCEMSLVVSGESTQSISRPLRWSINKSRCEVGKPSPSRQPDGNW